MKLKKGIISLAVSISILLSGINIYAAQELDFVNGYYEITCENDFKLIKDLSAKYKIVKDIELTNPKSLGSLTAPFSGEIAGALDGDAKIKPTITINSQGNFKGLVSYLKGGTIKNIVIDGKIETDANAVSAFVGIAKSGRIVNCINKADIESVYKNKEALYIGGIIGYTDAPAEVLVSNCENYGTITCTSTEFGGAGGIGGKLAFSNVSGSIKDCKNSGDINTTLKYAGGIAGELVTFEDLTLCANTGNITATDKKAYAGGIAGSLNGGISKSFNEGEIISSGISGGIAGVIKTDNISYINRCYNSGRVSGGAGIAGKAEGLNKAEISETYNAGETKVAVASASGCIIKNNYCLSDVKSTVKGITSVNSDQLKNIDLLSGFSEETWSTDETAEYTYPQIKGNKFGTLKTENKKITDSILFVEAEDAIYLPAEVSVTNDVKAAGGAYVNFLNFHSEIDIYNPEISEPVISFDFEVDKKSDISVWLRIRSTDTSQDSVFAGMDGKYALAYLTIEDDFYWKRVTSQSLEPGVHTVNVFPREHSSLDRILVTDSGLFSPNGLGGSPDDKIVEKITHEGPAVKPIAGHPRVYITKDKIAKIKANLTAEQNKAAYKKHNQYLENTTDGKLPQAASNNNNFDSTVLEIIESRAFDYVINGNEESGKSAINAMINFASTVTMDTTLYWGYYSFAGEAIHKLAIVYDWCYPLLTNKDKDYFHKMFVSLAQGTEMGWPPVNQSLLGGHGGETQLLRDMLAAGIAMYDEFPYIYNNVAGRFFDEAIEFRKDFHVRSAFHYEGDHYVQVRYGAELGAVLLLDAIGVPEVFGKEHGQIPYWMIYARRPDGATLRSGDSMHDSHPIGEYYDSYYELMFLAGNYYNDPYIKNEAMRESINLEPDSPYANQSLTPVEILIFNNPELEGRSLKELPLTKYFPSPQGGMIARTGWEDGIASPAVVSEMKISEFWFASHAHLDAGSFQIYYKGNLAADTGYYATNVGTGSDVDNTGRTYFGSVHFFNYTRRTIAHNSMLIYDPNERVTATNTYGVTPANDGGQRYPSEFVPETYEEVLQEYDKKWKTGETLSHEFGPDPVAPDYTYLKGDLSYAYSDKVAGFERSFMFLNLKNDEIPAAMLVFDRVESSDPSFKKTWLLHGREEPVIDGSHVTMCDTFDGHNGKLTLDTLLPEKPSIEKIGGPGKDFYYNGTNWHGLPSAGGSNESTDAWRIEVSPSKAGKEDLFLNVMQVSDANGTNEPLEVTGVYSDTHVGAIISDRVVMFGREKDRLNSEVSFSFDKPGEYKIAVSDLCEGTWEVSKDGEKTAEVIVTKDGGLAYFEGTDGSYNLKRINDTAEREPVEKEDIHINDLYVLSNGKYQYADVLIKNGISMGYVEDIAKLLNLKITNNGDESYTLSGYGKTITLKSNSLYAEGTQQITLSAAPEITDGKFYVPLRAVAEYFFYQVSYNHYPRSVSFNSKASIPEDGYVTIIDCSWKSNLTSSNGYASYDKSLGSSWATAAAAGTGDCEITYDFGTPQSISGIEASFSRSNERQFKYEIHASNDGVNWTPVVLNGLTELTEGADSYQLINFAAPVNTKYIKYVGKGNTGNNANNILEIKFKEAM